MCRFMVHHKARIPVAVVVVKSRLLDVKMSLETTPEENLLMAWETIACLQDNGLEVIVDLEHAMDAMCGRRENGEACDEDFRSAQPGVLPPDDGAVRGQQVSRIVVRHDGRGESRGGGGA